jgi:uncharacterized protein (TIGR00266 family)
MESFWRRVRVSARLVASPPPPGEDVQPVVNGTDPTIIARTTSLRRWLVRFMVSPARSPFLPQVTGYVYVNAHVFSGFALTVSETHPQGGKPMADIIDYEIFGDDMQLVEVELDHGEGVRAEAGAMMYKDRRVTMQTSTGGGMFKGFKRMIAGESFFITNFTFEGSGKGRVAFGAPYPGKVVPLDLDQHGGEFLCQKDSFLCAAAGIEIEVAFTKRLGAGLFGGEGFILQRLTGSGMAFVHAGGALIEKRLQPGESLDVDTGCLVGFSRTVDYDIRFVGGFKNALFGGEGVFLATVTGPGTVYLQSLPFSRLADRIIQASRVGVRHAQGERKGVGGIGGEILGGLLGGDR